MTCSNKIDQLIVYALAVASQEDDLRNRELGAIHLIKYVYLADLAFAKANSGATFTGVPWRFHHFGPWSEEVYERIKPTIHQLGGIERKVSSKYADDTLRWHLDYDPNLVERLDEGLPWGVARTVKDAVHRFGQDTSDLLHFVYTTTPMLKAAPGEMLSFAPEYEEAGDIPTSGEPKLNEKLSKSAQRRQADKLIALRERVAMKLKEKRERQRLASPTPEPRFDEIFLKGTEWLNQEAGEIIQPEKGEVTFSPDLWKSRARGEKLS